MKKYDPAQENSRYKTRDGRPKTQDGRWKTEEVGTAAYYPDVCLQNNEF